VAPPSGQAIRADAMAEVERLFNDYVAEHRAGGEADPVAYLDQAEEGERGELAALIDAYLARAPGREWDREAFAGSAAERLSDAVAQSLQGVSGTWPVVLPRLRHRAQVTRGELVRRLAAALEASDREAKVGGYYHEMERGLLPSGGVSTRVLEALGEIVGATGEFLRRAGQPLGAGGAPSPGEVYARASRPGAPAKDSEAADAAAEPAARPAEARDEVDELFTGGP
jgi:hypothetical protein